MNEPRFEVFPEKVPAARADIGDGTRLTGEFVWHFKDANGRITFTGGESFTRREDAHRSIVGGVHDVDLILQGAEYADHNLEAHDLPIVDLDENGAEVASPGAAERMDDRIHAARRKGDSQ
jgi:hypothetical protein